MELQQDKRTIVINPSPKDPLGQSSDQVGAASFDKCAEEEFMSVASTRYRATFESTPFKESPHTWTQIIGDQVKAGSPILCKTSNTSRGEPPRKTLSPFLGIGAAPIKPPKPDFLKFRLRKWQDKIIFAKRVTTAARTWKEGRPKTKSRHHFIVKNTVEPH